MPWYPLCGLSGVRRGFAVVALVFLQSTNAYVITFAGYNKLKSDYEEIISDLALADSKLQVLLLPLGLPVCVRIRISNNRAPLPDAVGGNGGGGGYRTR